MDARKMLGLPPEAFVFGTVGRLAPTKGLGFLIEAFSMVKEDVPSAELVLLGNGPCREELEQLIIIEPIRSVVLISKKLLDEDKGYYALNRKISRYFNDEQGGMAGRLKRLKER